MIHANRITRRADEDGVAATTVERDYVLAHVLASIATQDQGNHFVFKGGTALRLCHFDDYRYSADLDFSIVGDLTADGARELVEDVASMPIIRRYEDQEDAECLVYTLGEVAAEKLRCVVQRLQCRDLLDLHQLLVERRIEAELIWPTFERKARHRGLDPGRFREYFERRESDWKRRWDDELIEYLGTVPHFEETVRAVRRELRFALRQPVG